VKAVEGAKIESERGCMRACVWACEWWAVKSEKRDCTGFIQYIQRPVLRCRSDPIGQAVK